MAKAISGCQNYDEFLFYFIFFPYFLDFLTKKMYDFIIVKLKG